MRVDDKTLETIYDEKGDWLELQNMTRAEMNEHMIWWEQQLGGSDTRERFEALVARRFEHFETCTGFVPMSPRQETVKTTKRKMCLRM